MAATVKDVLELAIKNPNGYVGYVHPEEPMSDTDWPAIEKCQMYGWLKFVDSWREWPRPETSERREHSIWEITETGRAALNDQ